VDYLNDRVIPHFESNGNHFDSIFADIGSEFCGNLEHGEYQLYLTIENIVHSKAKAKHPQNISQNRKEVIKNKPSNMSD